MTTTPKDSAMPQCKPQTPPQGMTTITSSTTAAKPDGITPVTAISPAQPVPVPGPTPTTTATTTASPEQHQPPPPQPGAVPTLPSQPAETSAPEQSNSSAPPAPAITSAPKMQSSYAPPTVQSYSPTPPTSSYHPTPSASPYAPTPPPTDYTVHHRRYVQDINASERPRYYYEADREGEASYGGDSSGGWLSGFAKWVDGVNEKFVGVIEGRGWEGKGKGREQ